MGTEAAPERQMTAGYSEPNEAAVDRTGSGVSAVLLVGGMGTRLRSVVSLTPKPLAAVGGHSFLELLVQQLRYQGVHRLLMCTGYLADQFEQQFGDGSVSGIRIEYSRERQAMGTGGAVKLASHALQNEAEFLVMNGDSFIEMDFQRLLRFHREQRAFLSMAVRQVTDTNRYGRVEINDAGRVISFTEKSTSNGPGLVNAGVYVFSRDVLKQIPDGPASLEKDVFPKLLDRGIYAIEQQGMFIDIGTPEDYAQAQEICGRLYAAALNR